MMPMRRRRRTPPLTARLRDEGGVWRQYYLAVGMFLLLPSWSTVTVVDAKKPTRRTTPQHHAVLFTLPQVPVHTSSTPRIDRQELADFIVAGTNYLMTISHTADQDPLFPGRFTYITQLHQDLRPSLHTPQYWDDEEHAQDEYNLLRHNGALYALTQSYQRLQRRPITTTTTNSKERAIDKERLLQVIQQGVHYLRDNALLPPPSQQHPQHESPLLAAWERQDLNDPQSIPTTAKLGGAGLALLALTQLDLIQEGAVPLQEVRALGNFIATLQNPRDGSFTCKYHWKTGPDDAWQSLYYPGEAALGLVELARTEVRLLEHPPKQQRSGTTTTTTKQQQQQDPYPQWLKLAKNTLLYLERYRREQPWEAIEPDHWALLATAQLLPLLHQQREDAATEDKDTKQDDVEYWLIYQHGIRVATAMIANSAAAQAQGTDSKTHQHTYGCFTSDMRTCPTATRLEGLLAALTFIQDSEVYLGDPDHADTTTELLRDRIEHDVTWGIQFLLHAQHTTTEKGMRGAMPGKVRPQIKGGTDHEAAEEESSSDDQEDPLLTEVRVDYVQHSLSAVIAYEAYLLQKEEKVQQDQKRRPSFHTNMSDKVHKVQATVTEHVHTAQDKVHHVTDHVKQRLRTQNSTTTPMDTFINVALLLGILLFFFVIVVYVLYVPSYLLSSSSSLSVGSVVSLLLSYGSSIFRRNKGGRNKRSD